MTCDRTCHEIDDTDCVMMWQCQVVLLVASLFLSSWKSGTCSSSSSSLWLEYEEYSTWSWSSYSNIVWCSVIFSPNDYLMYSAPYVSSSMSSFSISFFIILAYHDRVHASEIHSWQDNISLIKPLSNMVHIDPLTEPEAGDKLGKRPSNCTISHVKKSGVKLEPWDCTMCCSGWTMEEKYTI